MGTVLLILVSVLLLGLAAWATRFLVRRGRRQAEGARDLAIHAPGGVQEAMFLRIGGIDQWVQIRGEDRRNPVVLVLHGGMAMSYMSLTPAFRAWEKRFTVVQWDRRGVGKTFGRNGPSGSGEMTLERIAEDGVELAEVLAQRFGRRKIILLGHSMGSQIGVTMAARRPDLFHVYVGTEQIVDMARNEAASYALIGERLKAQGDLKGVARLQKLGPPPYPRPIVWGVKQSLAEKADPFYGRTLQKDIGAMLMFNPTYRLKDLIDFIRANQFCGARLFEQWMAFDANRLGSRFGLPVVVVQGREDVMTPAPLVQAWLGSLQAPRTELVLLEAGHLSMMTTPEAYLAALETHVRPLALEADTPA